MAGALAKVILIGNVGRDPEARTTPAGDNVTDFSVAVSERRRGKDGQQQEQTTWFRISAWGKLGETCAQYLRKGSSVYVEGSLTQREYTDREGATRTSLDVRASEMKMLDRRGDNANDGDAGSGGATETGARPTYSSRPPTATAASDDDDIPF